MEVVILVWDGDPVAVNVLKVLVENFGFREGHEPSIYKRHDATIMQLTVHPLYSDEILQKVDADLIIVPSRHRSESGRPSLLTHPVGNWSEDTSFGGRPKTLSKTSAQAIYSALTSLIESADEMGLKGFEVGMEVTHHGPYSESPLIFIEVGSTPREWSDGRLAEAVARACIMAYNGYRAGHVAVGFGGGHYARAFVRLSHDSDVAFGHMAPKYRLPLNGDIVAQAFEKTIENPDVAYLEWDGMRSDHREELIRVLKALGKDYQKC